MKTCLGRDSLHERSEWNVQERSATGRSNPYQKNTHCEKEKHASDGIHYTNEVSGMSRNRGDRTFESVSEKPQLSDKENMPRTGFEPVSRPFFNLSLLKGLERAG